MSVLPTTPAKPAVTRVPDGAPGTALLGHRWQLSPAALGRFLAGLPAPMQLGKVEFDDGTWRTAFGCDASAATGADISAYGSWPAAIASGRGLARRRVLAYVTVSRPQRAITQHSTAEGSSRYRLSRLASSASMAL